MRLLILLIITIKLNAQDIVYVTPWKSEADIDIIWTQVESNADVVINPVSSRWQLHSYSNSWLFTTQQSHATLRVRVVNGGNAVRVYIRKQPRQFVSYAQKNKYQTFFNNTVLHSGDR